jgi:hypothetical protein
MAETTPALPPEIAAKLDEYATHLMNFAAAVVAGAPVAEREADEKCTVARAALEAEIATLAQRAIDANRYEDAILWALGAEGEFAPQPPTHGRYWWRRELRERAGELRAARTPTGGTPT